MKVIKHTASGYEWEGDCGRRAAVTLGAKTCSLALSSGKTGTDGTYKGDAFACRAIALSWVQGFTPGCTAIKWRKGTEPKWPEPIFFEERKFPSPANRPNKRPQAA